MSVTAATVNSPLSDLLQTVYRKEFKRHYNVESAFLQAVPLQTKTVPEGQKLSFAADVGLGGGYAWTGSSRAHPPASVPEVDRYEFNYGTMLSAIQFDPLFVKSSAGELASADNPLKRTKNATIVAYRQGLNFDIVGADGTGKVADMHATPAATSTTFKVSSVRGLRNGLRVDVLLSANGAAGSSGVIGARIAINQETLVVTLLADDGVAKVLTDGGTDLNANPGNYKVYRHMSYKKAIFSLGQVIARTNVGGILYGGIDRTDDTKDWWRAQRLHNSATPRRPKWKLFQQMEDEIRYKSDGRLKMVLVHPTIYDVLLEDEDARRRHIHNGAKKLFGWADAIDFHGIPIVKDHHMSPTIAYGLDTEMWCMYQNGEADWLKSPEGQMWRPVPGLTHYMAIHNHQLQLVCHSPAAQCVLEDLADVA